VCAGTVLIACTAAWWVMNRPKVAEFLIQTQGELRRIAWPSRREYQAASVAVIALVLFLGLFVFVVDEGLSWLFQKLGIGI
jgi:preprotein translocase subunit SecE